MQQLLETGVPLCVSDKKELEEKIGKFFGQKCRIIDMEKRRKKEWCITIAREKLMDQSKEVKILLYEQKMKEGKI